MSNRILNLPKIVKKAEERKLIEEDRRLTALFQPTSSINLASVIENSPDGIVVFDFDFCYLYINASAERLLGKPRAELLGQEAWKVFPRSVGTKTYLYQQKAMTERVSLTFEYDSGLSDKTYQISCEPGPEGMTVYFRDITAQKKAQMDEERTLKALGESEWFRDRLLKTLPDIVYVYDLDTNRNVYMNHEFVTLLGHSIEAIQESEGIVYNLIHPEDLPGAKDRWKQYPTLSDGDTLEMMVRMRHANGSYRSLHCRETIFTRHTDGRPRQILGIAQDATVPQESAEALRISEHRLRMATENGGVGIFQVTFATGTIYASALCRKHLGLEPNSEITRDIMTALIHPEDRAMVRGNQMRAVQEQRPYEMEYRVIWPDNSVHWIYSKANPVFGEDGRPLRVDGACFEITERKITEERLLLLEMGVKEASNAFCIIEQEESGELCVKYVNPAFEQMSGYRDDEVIGKPFSTLEGMDTSSQTLTFIREKLEECVPFQVEVLTHKKDGTPFWAELDMRPFAATNGNYTRWIVMQRDITEQKNEAAQLAVVAERQERIAETLQRSLLMVPSIQQFPGLELHPVYHAALEESLIGGDFFDAFAVDERHVALVVGDVTGKGLEAAAENAEVKYVLRSLLREDPYPTRALEKMNRYLWNQRRLDGKPTDVLVSVAIAILEPETGRVEFGVAGMEPPLILRTATHSTEQVTVGGMPLGAMRRWTQEGGSFVRHLNGGDTLLLYSDGLTDIRRGAGAHLELFGTERLTEALRRSPSEGTLEKVGDEILAQIEAFDSGARPDDLCLLLARQQTRDENKSFIFSAENLGTQERIEIGAADIDFAEIAEESGDAIFIFDREGRFRYVNWQGERVFNRSRGELIGQTLREVTPDMTAPLQEIFDRCLRERTPHFGEMLCKLTWRWFSVRCMPYREGVQVYMTDIHARKIVEIEQENARKRAEADQKRARKAAEESREWQRKFLSEVLSNVTHGRLQLCNCEEDIPEPLPVQGNPIELSRPTLADFRREVERVAQWIEMPLARRGDFLMAAGEAAMNAVVHGNGGKASVHADPEKGLMQVVIRDTGGGIQTDMIHRATLESGWSTGNSLGQGFQIILSTTDRVHLYTGPVGTTVVLEQGIHERIDEMPHKW